MIVYYVRNQEIENSPVMRFETQEELDQYELEVGGGGGEVEFDTVTGLYHDPLTNYGEWEAFPSPEAAMAHYEAAMG